MQGKKSLAQRKMEDIIEEIRKVLKAELYLSSLFLAFAIPDICSAVESENYQTDSTKYKKWFDKYLIPINPNKYGANGQLKSEQLWIFRCKLFHQGASSEKDKTGFLRLLFADPKADNFKSIKSLHCVAIGDNRDERSLLINIQQFCYDLILAYEDWLKEKENTNAFQVNHLRIVRRYPNGISPIFGTPTIG